MPEFRYTKRLLIFTLLFITTVTSAEQQKEVQSLKPLEQALTSFIKILQITDHHARTIELTGTFEDRDKKIPVSVLIAKDPQRSLRLRVTYDKTTVDLQRTPEQTFVYRSDKNLLFTSKTTEQDADENTPLPRMLLSDLTKQIGNSNGIFQNATNLIQTMNGPASIAMLNLAGVKTVPMPDARKSDQHLAYTIGVNDKIFSMVQVHKKTNSITDLEIIAVPYKLTLAVKQHDKAVLIDTPKHEKMKHVMVSPNELESAFAKGIRRALDIQHDRYLAPKLTDKIQQGPHGEYIIRDGQRIVRLRGNPQQIGFQHGQFLKSEVRKVIDSTLYVVGTVYSLESGKWFLDEIRSARKRLDIHTPEEYRVELDAVAEGAGIPIAELRMAAYFPALFHCSGFAISGDVTQGGKLFHGRVLDYMTGIGLEENAVVFIVSKDGKIPFANVGYAAFIGSVTGMNEKQISLGEMGGRGEGKWDGISMPILMRMALENATTLQEAKDIFANNKRTCEYYYVFADGKDRSSVGVYATPEQITFLKPGEYHDLLPTPIKGCVLLSAGNRYKSLCLGVREPKRKLGVQDAIRLMDAPVAMGNSNLHSVLFVPEDLDFHVSNAAASGPAYMQNYYHYNLRKLLTKELAKK